MNRLVSMILLIVVLCVLPLFANFHYVTLYYTGIAFLIPYILYRTVWERTYEKSFYKRWKKRRENGFWWNVIIEGVRSLFFIVLIVVFSQLVGNGITPSDIVTELSEWHAAGVLFLLLMISFLIGIAAWFEKNKKYQRLKIKE